MNNSSSYVIYDLFYFMFPFIPMFYVFSILYFLSLFFHMTKNFLRNFGISTKLDPRNVALNAQSYTPASIVPQLAFS